MSVILKAKGVRQVSRSEMMSFSVPAKTESYSPVSNQEIIETTLEELDKNGFQVKSEFHKCDGSREKFVGGFIISGGSSEANLMFGYKNSYDRSMTAAYALGAQIIVCSNSVVRGEQSLIRKHTGDALSIIKNGISEGIKRLGDNFLSFQNEMKRMKEIEISKSVYAGLVGRLYIEDEIITSHQLSIIKKEFDKESYDYGVKDSLYNLYQAVTLSLKTAHPVRFLNDHLAANEFFTKEAGLFIPSGMFNPSPVKANVEEVAPNQMNIYDIPGVVEDQTAVVVETMVETAPEDVENLPMASRDCFKPTTSETTTEYQDLM